MYPHATKQFYEMFENDDSQYDGVYAMLVRARLAWCGPFCYARHPLFLSSISLVFLALFLLSRSMISSPVNPAEANPCCCICRTLTASDIWLVSLSSIEQVH